VETVALIVMYYQFEIGMGRVYAFVVHLSLAGLCHKNQK
jgi:hypothetical protein